MAGVVWCWRRRIRAATAESWLARLDQLGCRTGIMTEKPGRACLMLEVYGPRKTEAVKLQRALGGTLHEVRPAAWMPGAQSSCLQIAPDLEIRHASRRSPSSRALHVPHGLAFGSGEHATTLMLLRALARWPAWPGTTFLDVGTGSGILALVGRKRGARRVDAFDFDPDSVRTARENEKLNFETPAIHWRRADVTAFQAAGRYRLITANLFSNLLVQAAPALAQALASGGQLWLSGILRDQADEVAKSYRRAGLQLLRTVSRGKWVMQRWKRKDRSVNSGSVRSGRLPSRSNRDRPGPAGQRPK